MLRRAAALAALMVGSRGVAVAGTHGKTTTTSMLTVALQHAGLDPSFAIGGDLNEAGSNAHAGTGDVFVAEADESDGSFLLLSPFGAIVTNVEPDHLDHYGSREAVDAAFAEFVRTHRPGRLPRASAPTTRARPGSSRSAASAGLRVVSYGESEGADVRVAAIGGGRAGSPPGLDRARPAARRCHAAGARPAQRPELAAGASPPALELGLSAPATAATGWPTYRGVRRRFELKGERAGRARGRRLRPPPDRGGGDAARRPGSGRAGAGSSSVFQPHRYSRTAPSATSSVRRSGWPTRSW